VDAKVGAFGINMLTCMILEIERPNGLSDGIAVGIGATSDDIRGSTEFSVRYISP